MMRIVQMKLNVKNSILFLGMISLFSSFKGNDFSKKMVIENTLNFNRVQEVVSVDLKKSKAFSTVKNYNDLLIKNEKGELLVTQLIDNNLDGTAIETDEYVIKSVVKTTFGFTFIEGQWAYMAKNAIVLEIPFSTKIQKIKIVATAKEIIGKVIKENQQKVLVFELPKSDAYTKLVLIMDK